MPSRPLWNFTRISASRFRPASVSPQRLTLSSLSMPWLFHDLPRGSQEATALGMPGTATPGWRVPPEVVQPSNEPGHDYLRLGSEGSQGGDTACCGGPAWPHVARLRGGVSTSLTLAYFFPLRHVAHPSLTRLNPCKGVVKIDGTLMG